MKPYRLLLIVALGVVLTLACSLLSNALPGASAPSADSPPSGEGSSETGDETAEGPDMLDMTLGLRSVSLSLTASYPDGSVRSLTAEIDAQGNLYLVEPFDLGTEVQATLTPPEAGRESFELFLVDGHAYLRMSGEAAVQDDAYLTSLADTLRGPDGPGLWLVLAGTEELEPAAHEDMGGFAAIRYPVEATIEDGTIQGTMWMDEETLALVRAELTVSPTLFSTTADPASGDLTILFEVEQADIATIRVP